MDYYLANLEGQQSGPFSLEQMRTFWANGQITQASRFWMEGMADWKPIKEIEGALKPSPNVGSKEIPPSTALIDTLARSSDKPPPPPSRSKSKSASIKNDTETPTSLPESGSKPKRKGLGCGQGCVLLIVLFGAFIAFVMLMEPDGADTSKPKVDPSWNKGYTSAYELGYACALSDYNGGKLKESPDELDANARELSGGSTDAEYRAGVISGLKAGYDDGWKQGGR